MVAKERGRKCRDGSYKLVIHRCRALDILTRLSPGVVYTVVARAPYDPLGPSEQLERCWRWWSKKESLDASASQDQAATRFCIFHATSFMLLIFIH